MNDKKRILKQIQSRFQTTMIGSLARFEDSFGYLWGHNGNENLTEREEEFLEMWNYVRTSILNHGSKQMRECVDDMIAHMDEELHINRYNFLIQPPPPPPAEETKETI